MLWMNGGPQTLEAQIAVDEALVDRADREVKSAVQQTGQTVEDVAMSPVSAERLRVWESPQNAVILGRSSRVNEEVVRDRCEQLGVPILRRSSGGATVVIGPGCLMYSVLISHQVRPACRELNAVHALVMNKWLAAFEQLGIAVQFQGTCDLTSGNRKFSGNSLRVKRDYTMYHGTILYRFDLQLVDELLKMPPRRPSYREDRRHSDFVTNVDCDYEELSQALRSSWHATASTDEWPAELTAELVKTKYSTADWNMRR